MSDIQIRNGTLMQIGSCLSCGNGCSNNRDAEIMNMKFVEITVGNLKFRLCGDCKNTLKNLLDEPI